MNRVVTEQRQTTVPWYHGEIAKDEAERLVSENGDFLLRSERLASNVAASSDARYVITANWSGKRWHLAIKSRRDERTHPPVYYYDEGPRSVRTPAFSNVFALVDFLRNERVPLCTERCSFLLRPIPKQIFNAPQDETGEVERRPKLDRGRVAMSARRVPIRNVKLWQVEQQLADYSQLDNVLRAAAPLRAMNVKPNESSDSRMSRMKPLAKSTLNVSQNSSAAQEARGDFKMHSAMPTVSALGEAQRERSKSADKLLDSDVDRDEVATEETERHTALGRLLGIAEQRLSTLKPLDGQVLSRLRTMFTENINVELCFDALSRTLSTLVHACFHGNAAPKSVLHAVLYAEAVRNFFTALLVCDASSVSTQSTLGTSRDERREALVAKMVELVCFSVRRLPECNTERRCANQLLFVAIASVLYDPALAATVRLALDCDARRSVDASTRRVNERVRSFFLTDAKAHLDAALRLRGVQDRLPNVVPYLLVTLFASYPARGADETRSRVAAILSWCVLEQFSPSVASDPLLNAALDELSVLELVLSCSRPLVSLVRAEQQQEVARAPAQLTSLETAFADLDLLLLAPFGASVQAEIRQRCLLRQPDEQDVRFWFDACERMGKILGALKLRFARS